MKKIISGLVVAGMFSFAMVANAVANWNVSGDWVFDYYYGGSNLHDMTLVQAPDGSLSGTGGAFSGVEPYAYPWTVVSGSVDGDSITLTADMDTLDCLFTLTGTIVGGAMSGTWTDDCDGERNGTWETTSGNAVEVTSSTVVVHPSDMALNIADVIDTPTKWFFYNDENDTINNSLGSFVIGPESAPLGIGSTQMSVTGTERRNLATYQFKDVKLSNISELSFSTYSQLTGDGANGLSERAPYLHFNVDFDNSDTWQRRLVYVPALNGVVTADTWQSWDAIDDGNALWRYSGATWPTTADAGTTSKTWSQILALYPNAETRSTDSWLGFRVGEPYADGFTGNVDNVIFGTVSHTTTFDFDPELETVVSGGGHINTTGGKGKKLYTFSVDLSVANEDLGTALGSFTLVNHAIQTTCTYEEITNLGINGDVATFTADDTDGTCLEVVVTINDLGEPGAGVDKLTVTAGIAETLITGGNFQVVNLE